MVSPAEDEYGVEVGYVLGPRGDEGAVVVEPLSDVPGRLAQLDQAWLQPRSGPGRLRAVAEVPAETPRGPGSSGHLVMRIEGVTTREQAERLRGAVLKVRAEDSPPLPPGLFYVHQIIGLEVVTTDGRSLGRVDQVVPTGANDVYRVGDYLIPAIRQVIVEINLAEGRITIDPMPGLLDRG